MFTHLLLNCNVGYIINQQATMIPFWLHVLNFLLERTIYL